MHQAVELPLALYFAFASEAESVQPLIGQITKHRFHGGHAMGIDSSALVTVHMLLHPFGTTQLGNDALDIDAEMAAQGFA